MTKILKVVGASWLQTKISSYILGILGVLAILSLFVGQIERIQEDGNYAATVFFSNKTGYRIEYWGQSNELADIPRGVARAYFRMDIDTTGWSLLEVETDPSYSDEHQAYAAGIVEGALTWSLIHMHLENTIRAKCDNQPVEKECHAFRDELDKSAENWKTYAAERGDDPFWHQVMLYYTQISGIFTGWKHGVVRSTKEYDTDLSDLYWLNFVSEAIEMQRKMNMSIDEDPIEKLPHLSSAFLRVVEANTQNGTPTKKIYVSQNAAGSYSTMTRILKRYKLNYHKSESDSNLVQGTTVEFSGYPGSITSQDEFYIVKGEDHRMAITGTALRNYNDKLSKDVNITTQVPVGPRVVAANRLASNVTSWGHILASSNSGTASKQWLVVDFNRFDHLHTLAPRTEETKPNHHEIVTETTVDKDIRHIVMLRHNNGPKGLVALVEQVPGLTHSADLSDVVLKKGYWATYGLPFFEDISEITAVKHMEELYGNIFSESESPRAMIFKQGFKNATSLESILALMRHNNVTEGNSTSDSTEDCSDDVECIVREDGYWSVIGVRGDIVTSMKEAYGVIDTKVVSGTLNSTTLEFFALSGPTYTEIQPNRTKTAVNKGNIAPIYTELVNENPDLNGIEIRDLVKHQQEKEEEDKMELLNKDLIKPFNWSESIDPDAAHMGLPDKWAFEPFAPHWSW